MPDDKALLPALQAFADSVSAKMNTLTVGEPEDQLRGPFETFMQAVGEALVLDVVCTGETKLEGRLGRPDYAIHSRHMLTGYAELKAPGKGANDRHFRGHDRKQFKRFSAIPNLLYTDGNEWALYREGKTDRPIVRLSGDIATEGAKAVTQKDAVALTGLLTDFMQWEPTIPCKRGGTIDLKAFARMLAPLAHMLREDVKEALHDPESPLVALAKDWRQLLFPDADDDRFADEYAQTVTFALLLARSENADPLTLPSAETTLTDGHSLLARALQLLTEKDAQKEISASLDLILRVIAKVPPASLKSPREAWLFRHKETLPLAVPDDPWMFFYEDFLAEYDPKLRKDVGAYYTPVEVVLAQVRLIDDLLTNRLGKPLGFADPDVNTLDPAVGTGTYLLAVIDHALAKVHELEGQGTVPGKAKTLSENVYGFELMAGPFAVSQLRITLALQDWANLKGRGRPPKIKDVKVYLTDTLESPNTPPPELGHHYKPISDQHAKALKVKKDVPVIVCLGNPPYDRHDAVDPSEETLSRYGGWVRFGDSLQEGTVKGKGKKARTVKRSPEQQLKRRQENSILQDFIAPVIDAGLGGHLKNLYNLYVYFWRWALWKVFESKTSAGPGVVSFISASSYLDGDAFGGMREHMRRQCDELWILDLGGEGRGTRQSDNVFAIKTPVAIAIALREGKADPDTPATVRYARVEGRREQKLKTLADLSGFSALEWEDCPDDWHAPFRPAGSGTYFGWAELIALFPWQQGGVKAGRTWVRAPSADTLRERWRVLCHTEQAKRVMLFKDSPTGRKATDAPSQLPPRSGKLKPITEVLKNASTPHMEPYAYRSFDRQHVFADARTLDRPGPSLWAAHGKRQVYLTSLLNHPLGGGPALTPAAEIPDLHHFRGSYGAKEVMPLYRDATGKEPNILPGLLELLGEAYGREVSPEDFLAYVYGVLAQPAFTERFADELGTRELRVPLTKDAGLFVEVRDVGAKLLWLHTYGERYVPEGKSAGQVPRGEARCTVAVPGDEEGYPESFEYDPDTRTLHVGEGAFAPVAPEVYAFEVSGLKVVQSWLGYRMKNPKGKKSSPLDEINPTEWPSQFNTELLELLWVLEATLAEYPRQAELLEQVVEGECFKADQLPDVPEYMRKAPKRKKDKDLFD